MWRWWPEVLSAYLRCQIADDEKGETGRNAENWLPDLNTLTDHTEQASFPPLYNAAWILLGDIPLYATADSLCLSTNTSRRDPRETWLPLWVSVSITKPCYLILNETVSYLLDRIAHYNINLQHSEQIGDITFCWCISVGVK